MLTVSLSPAIATPVGQARVGDLTSHQIPLRIRFVKRLIDVVVATVALLLVAPFIPLLMLAVWLDSPGPVFYRQRRASGLRRRSRGRFEFHEFDMLKFRTMRVDAEKCTGAVLASEDDPRVTRVGRFLRKKRLDELPQLWNVLEGSMSIVGPRPERSELLENLVLAEIAAAERYLLNPYKLDGTDGAEADDMRTKLLFDLAYPASLEHLGTYLWTELGIIARTPWVMLRGIGR
jgi:lipopolysaccharide/colanic/teichoic acid biosynthesis glycosyltransferase